MGASQEVMSREEYNQFMESIKRFDPNADSAQQLFEYGVPEIVRNSMNSVSNSSLVTLTKAKVSNVTESNSNTLKFNHTDINSIDEDAFQDRPNLEFIDLGSNNLVFIEASAFKYLSHLKKLILSFNLIYTLEANTFSGIVETLEELEITNSKLKTIKKKAFAGLVNLKRLILAYNNLEYIEPDTFVDLTRLELLVISFNKLSSLNEQTFRSLVNLKRLNLKSNKLTTISSTTLSHLKKLEQIILSVNELSSIDNVFDGLDNLERLFVHTNKVTRLTRESFRGLVKCVFVDIGSNQISEIETNAFKDLANMEYIDLSKNSIKTIEKGTFKSLAKVEKLILSKNSISHVDVDTFRGMNNLKFLMFDFNKLTWIDSATFSWSSALQEINCNTLSMDIMQSLQENIIKHNQAGFLDDIAHVADYRDVDSLLSSFDAFKRVERISFYTNRHKLRLFKLIDKSTLKRVTKVITLGLNVIFTDLDRHIAKYKPFVNKPEHLMLKFLNSFMAIVKTWSNTLVTFCDHFYHYSGVKIIMNYLNSDVLKANLLKKIDDDSKYSFEILMSIMRNLLSSLYNLIKKDDKRYKNQIVELNAFESLLKIAEAFDSIGDFRLKSYLCLSEIIDDKNVSHLVNIKIVIKDLVDYISACASNLKESKNIERCPLVVDSVDEADSTNIREALIIEVNDTYFYVTEFLNVLYNLAVSDETKFDIYENFAMKRHLAVFVDAGNSTEREYALKLLWQLCFDRRVARDIADNRALMSQLNEMKSLKDTVQNANVIKCANGILWLLDGGGSDESKPKTEEKKSLAKQEQPQIMISYNSKSREICMKVKGELEKIGFRVWIDVESIYGSSLETMANAIDTSFCVLICVSEKYKESNFCRLEAEYVVQTKKPFVPLFLQPGYKPNGWLGLVIGSRIYIDFDKLGFDKAIDELKRNIKLIIKEIPQMNMEIAVETQPNKPNQINVETKKEQEDEKTKNMSSKQVELWMKGLDLNPIIIESLNPCDGQVLHQIYLMLKTNPEFFYSSMRNSGLNSLKDLKDVAYFSNELAKLFEK